VFLKFISVCILLSGITALSFEVQARSPVSKGEDKSAIEKPWRNSDKEKKEPTDRKKIAQMARDLLAKPSWSDRFINIIQRQTPKVALHPFKEKDLPVSVSELEPYIAALQQAMVRVAKRDYAIVSRSELKAVIADMNEMGSASNSVNPIGDLIIQAQADLLAVGTVTLHQDKLVLSYQLVETQTGRIVSSTQKRFKRKKVETNSASQSLSLEEVIIQSTDVFKKEIKSGKSLEIKGVSFENSGIHTKFSHYLLGHLSDAFINRTPVGAQNFNQLTVREFEVGKDAFRGLKLNARQDVNQQIMAQKDYVLEGQYWVIDPYVEIRLKLFHKGRAVKSWKGRILKSEISPGLKLRPEPKTLEKVGVKNLGPTLFSLTSNRGDNPTYHVGDEMVLAVTMQESGFLSCYYAQASGEIMQIYPNRYSGKTHAIAAGTIHIPKKDDPFAFEFTPPKGVEAVRCFLTDKDVSATISKKIGQGDFTPLDLESERDLSRLYRSIKNIKLNEASMMISVQ
jgi:hypothetical protein